MKQSLTKIMLLMMLAIGTLIATSSKACDTTYGTHCPASYGYVLFRGPCPGDGFVSMNPELDHVYLGSPYTQTCCIDGHQKSCDYQPYDCGYIYLEKCFDGQAGYYQSVGFDIKGSPADCTGCNWDGKTLCGG